MRDIPAFHFQRLQLIFGSVWFFLLFIMKCFLVNIFYLMHHPTSGWLRLTCIVYVCSFIWFQIIYFQIMLINHTTSFRHGKASNQMQWQNQNNPCQYHITCLQVPHKCDGVTINKHCSMSYIKYPNEQCTCIHVPRSKMAWTLKPVYGFGK